MIEDSAGHGGFSGGHGGFSGGHGGFSGGHGGSSGPPPQVIKVCHNFFHFFQQFYFSIAQVTSNPNEMLLMICRLSK